MQDFEDLIKTCPVCRANFASRECPRCNSKIRRTPNEGFIPPERLPEAKICDEAPESSLQTFAEDYCRSHGFPYFHDRSRGKNQPGIPDLVIALPGGRTLWVELKAKGGRLSEEQKRWRLELLALGHEWHECRSRKRFLEIMEGNCG